MAPTDSINIAAESPLQDDVRRLIAALNAHLLAVCEPPHYHMTPEEISGSDTTVFIARQGSVAVACGALRRHPWKAVFHRQGPG
jgi:putative acetyltransferase